MRTVGLFVIVCSMLAGCGGSPTRPTDVVIQSEIFTGTLSMASNRSHIFRVLAPGPVDITLTKAGPPDDVVIGLGVGTPSTTGTCPLEAYVATAAGPTEQLFGNVTSAGSLCVAVFDLNLVLTGDIDYAITVLHP